MLAIAHRQHMPLTHHTIMLPQYLDLLPIIVRQAMQLTTVALHPIYMLHMSSTSRHSISFSPQYSSYSQFLMSTLLMHTQSLAPFFTET